MGFKIGSLDRGRRWLNIGFTPISHWRRPGWVTAKGGGEAAATAVFAGPLVVVYVRPISREVVA